LAKKELKMTILKHELRSQKLSILIWSLSIGFLIAICVFMYPQMKSEMDNVNEMFSSMGSFTAAFGMDRLNFGTLLGFYIVEAGNILGIGGAFFAAVTAVSALMKEEKERTAEFLMTHPVSRNRIVAEKLLGTFVIILILNIIVFICSVGSILIIGEDMDFAVLLLFHAAALLMQFEIAGICFCISAFLTGSGMGIGIGIAAGMYFLNIVANISEKARILKYITPFGYTEGADIISERSINAGYLLLGMIFMITGIVIAFVKYNKKDIC